MTIDLRPASQPWTVEDCQRWLAVVRIEDITESETLLGDGIANYKELGRRIKQLEKLQEQVKYVVDNTMQTEKLTQYACDAGTACYRAGYTRITYNAEALDVLAQNSAELAEQLLPYRTETPVKGSLAIS